MTQLVDNFGRKITYIRMSVTDRCDFRCVYCMSEEMTFLPRAQVLTLEELGIIGKAFVDLGIQKIRLTGGEPLVRPNIIKLVKELGQLKGLNELALTTNGGQLEKHAAELSSSGVQRINISLDSLKPQKFKQLTRIGDLSKVIRGIDAAQQAGFKRIKIIAVILKNRNDDEVISLLEFALNRGLDISYIEEMPLGHINEHNRAASFCSSKELRSIIAEKYQLLPTTDNTGGPSRYWSISGHQSRIGFISPESENFCDSCNRVRLTVEGRLLLCLGNEHSIDLRAILRRYPGDNQKLQDAIIESMKIKPERHYFNADDQPQILRFMNTTGG